MKLRNKKTGEIREAISQAPIDVYFYDQAGRDGLTRRSYKSLAELNEEWEDIEDTNVTNMPLIEDEKIRKAVRAWADVNGISRCVCKDETHCVTFETERGMFISFENADPIPPEGNFTITELCGEEEE